MLWELCGDPSWLIHCEVTPVDPESCVTSMNVLLVVMVVAVAECECKWPSFVLSVMSTVTLSLPSFL